MQSSPSNAPQRHARIRQATFLTLIPVLLAGLGGFLFPFSQYVDTQMNGADCVAKMDTLDQMQEALALLDRQLADLAADYTQVLQKDQQWEGANASGRGPLKVDIERLESGMAKRKDQVDPALLDSLGRRTADAYTALLGARKTIWELRNQPFVEDSDGDGTADKELQACQREIDQLKLDIRMIAKDVEEEANMLEGIRAPGIFGNRKAMNEEVDRRSEATRALAGRLRDLLR